MARLIIDDGNYVFKGKPFGYLHNSSGEIVFQTGMVGYVESMTDPSYYGQILVFTYPLIGNHGVPPFKNNEDDSHSILNGHFESNKLHLSGLVVSTLTNDTIQTHWQAKQSLSYWMEQNKIVGIEEIDTRALTKIIRESGTLKAKIIIDGSDENIYYTPDMINAVSHVSINQPKFYQSPIGNDVTVIAVDCGMKYNQLRCFLRRGINVLRVPFNYDFTNDILTQKFHGVFVSNGPSDPMDCQITIGHIQKFFSLFEESNLKNRVPLFGICLGHQLISLACGATTNKMRYGHRSHNQPCRCTINNRTFVTLQNHGYAVDAKTMPNDWSSLFINNNDQSNEGFYHIKFPYFTTQFHPEHRAGPKDLENLFDVFFDLMKNYKEINNDLSKISIKLDDCIEKYLNPVTNIYKIQRIIKKVLILGSGGLSIGQAGEFDYSGSQAIKALKEEGISVIVVNPNIATVQTSRGLADKVYLVPINVEYVSQIIESERPDGILLSFGGQTALNCGIELKKTGVLQKFDVIVLGTQVSAVEKSEDRCLFACEIEKINEKVAPCFSANNFDEALEVSNRLGFPVLIRSTFSLGGLYSGFAKNKEELFKLTDAPFSNSIPILIDKSLQGWKELEYEIIRDGYGNCLAICNMENIDPLGIHTGESIVVSPSQTLTNDEYNSLRTAAIKIANHFEIIGECNVQFALDPNSSEYYVIEMNARLSRSSALASKATGFPLAYIAAKLAIGRSLAEIPNAATKSNYDGVTISAAFEPSLDYVVVKIPRWDLNKFESMSNKIGSSMKSVGEVMAIGRRFEEAFQKALRMVDDSNLGFYSNGINYNKEELIDVSYKRPFIIAAALENGESVENIYELTKIDKFFLNLMKKISDKTNELKKMHTNLHNVTASSILEAKKIGFSDKQIALFLSSTELSVRKYREDLNIKPFVKQIDTVSAEHSSFTNYLYLTYNAISNDVINLNDPIIVLGSGVYRIGSSVEFDCCSVSCIRELRSLSKNAIVINNNPETVSTDFDESDRLYFEEITFETVVDIYEFEKPHGIILSMGGQQPNNIAMALHRHQIKILGTSPEMIDMAENRFKFSRMLDTHDIKQPLWKELTTIKEACSFAESFGYPVLIRPSYVLSGAAMRIVHTKLELEIYLKVASDVSREHPVVITKFIDQAKEMDIDAIASSGKLVCMVISEHIESAGVHSGDSSLILPAININMETKNQIEVITKSVAQALHVSGPFNLQLIAKDNQLYVIECNLRVSRSFPFVSKSTDCDLVAMATKIIVGQSFDFPLSIDLTCPRISVKVPQFSYSRLVEVDPHPGIEMASTGEVACFGETVPEAYLKAFLSTGIKLPKKGVLLSIGSIKAKTYLISTVRSLDKLGFKIFGTSGTVDFYSENNIKVQCIHSSQKHFNGNNNLSQESVITEIKTLFMKKIIDLVICVRMDNPLITRQVSSYSLGYHTRRMAIDFSIPLITDPKCAKLFVEALFSFSGRLPSLNTQIDSISSCSLIRLPGLIDCHVHLRDPGATHKEDFETGTKAALCGGITTVLCMPNTNPPIVDSASLEVIKKIAIEKAYCDYGIICGASCDNYASVASLSNQTVALKMYLNDTFTTLQLNSISIWNEHLHHWPIPSPVIVHAEGVTLGTLLYLLEETKRPVHVAHVSTESDILLIKMAKLRGLPVTCEVTPHHLFLNIEIIKNFNILSPNCYNVKPCLTTPQDSKSLWDNLDLIDCFATDHAPHLLEEKESGCCPGFPGLETILGLLLDAVNKNMLTLEDIILRMYTNPKKIFHINTPVDTFIEIDMKKKWTILGKNFTSKCKWTPFEGFQVMGKVTRVVLRGQTVMVDGKVLCCSGYGHDVISNVPEPLLVQQLQSQRCTTFQNSSEKEFDKLNQLKSGSPLTIKKVDNELHIIPLDKPEKYIANLSVTSLSLFETFPNIFRKLISNQFYNSKLFSVNQFDKHKLRVILNLAHEFRALMVQSVPVPPLLTGKILALAFFEVSTRTMLSFESAMKRLGGSTINFRPSDSSLQKGETFYDTINVLSSFANGIVIRHPTTGVLQKLSNISCPVINAGDGVGEHPTQALLDLFTIREEIGTVNGISVAIVGDLLNGRTVHSLVKILTFFSNVTIFYIPLPGLNIPEDVYKFVKSCGIHQYIHENLEKVISIVDVLYMTRIQKERFSPNDQVKSRQNFILTPELLNQSKNKMIVLHPLPRNEEISPDVDDDPRAAYFRQVEYGVSVRMALLSLMMCPS